jgi:hypothetical protein
MYVYCTYIHIYIFTHVFIHIYIFICLSIPGRLNAALSSSQGRSSIVDEFDGIKPIKLFSKSFPLKSDSSPIVSRNDSKDERYLFLFDINICLYTYMYIYNIYMHMHTYAYINVYMYLFFFLLY